MARQAMNAIRRGRAACGQLDSSVFYGVTPWLRIGLEGQNVTNTKSRQTMQQQIGVPGRARGCYGAALCGAGALRLLNRPRCQV